MKYIFLLIIIFLFQANLYSQVSNSPRLYAHKVVVDSVLQTKAYTYLKVRERIGEKDSVQWMALPLFQPKVGDVYYYESGLQMGEFQSKELNRTFDQILFLGALGTSPDMSDKNIVPAPVMDTIPMNATPPEVHAVVVKEVLQTSGYTYIRVKEGDKEMWLAIVKMPVIVGKLYTYDDASLMKDFTSKELKRTFKEIYFLAKLTLSTNSEATSKKQKEKPNATKSKSVEKKSVKIETAQGGISIATLFKNKTSYAGKTVIIKGAVSKFTPDIMDRNWIHIQDGTDYSGKYDLTITTNQSVKVKEGDVVTFEGKINLDKDFGSGYFFEVIMEDAALIK